jgi:hypothetical protein
MHHRVLGLVDDRVGVVRIRAEPEQFEHGEDVGMREQLAPDRERLLGLELLRASWPADRCAERKLRLPPLGLEPRLELGERRAGVLVRLRGTASGGGEAEVLILAPWRDGGFFGRGLRRVARY